MTMISFCLPRTESYVCSIVQPFPLCWILRDLESPREETVCGVDDDPMIPLLVVVIVDAVAFLRGGILLSGGVAE